MNKPLVAIGGSNGSGKDTIGKLLVVHNGFRFMSITEPLREEAKTRELPSERSVLAQISAEWRRSSGDLGVLVTKAVALFQPESDSYSGLVVASLRNPGEVAKAHELGGFVIWVDADPKLRYTRIMNSDRGRDAEDRVSYAQFLQQEDVEMYASGDEATLSLVGVRDNADARILNEGPEEDLYLTVTQVLSEYFSRFNLRG